MGHFMPFSIAFNSFLYVYPQVPALLAALWGRQGEPRPVGRQHRLGGRALGQVGAEGSVQGGRLAEAAAGAYAWVQSHGDPLLGMVGLDFFFEWIEWNTRNNIFQWMMVGGLVAIVDMNFREVHRPNWLNFFREVNQPPDIWVPYQPILQQ